MESTDESVKMILQTVDDPANNPAKIEPNDGESKMILQTVEDPVDNLAKIEPNDGESKMILEIVKDPVDNLAKIEPKDGESKMILEIVDDPADNPVKIEPNDGESKMILETVNDPADNSVKIKLNDGESKMILETVNDPVDNPAKIKPNDGESKMILEIVEDPVDNPAKIEPNDGESKMILQIVDDPVDNPAKIKSNDGESKMILETVENPVDNPATIELIEPNGNECKTVDNSVDNSSSPGTPNEIGLSKRQLKKILKRTKWLERKGEKRLRERTKAKEKRAHARANNIDLGPTRKELKKCTMADSSCKVTITIDMTFDSLMINKDIAKLIKQILRCYTLNRRAKAPVQFSLTGFEGKCKEEMQKHNGYEHWDVKFHPETYLNVYKGKKIVYLTSESDNLIDTLDPDTVYVIGGLVDHNSHKGHCHKLAVQEGIEHARLPIDKFLKMKARKVLTVDHVFEILLRVTEGKTWQEAFIQVLPERKNAQLVLPTESNCSSDSEAQDSANIENDDCDSAKITEQSIDERGETKDDENVA